MSRIGNLPVEIPENVTVAICEENDSFSIVEVKGPLGVLTQKVDSCISIDIKDCKIFFSVNKRESYCDKSALHGLFRMLVANMIIGVSKGFCRSLELIGVGFKAVKKEKDVLDFDLGFSHKVYFILPENVDVEVKSEKGKNILISLIGCDKQIVGLVAAKIRGLREVEPYKGKGFRYLGEFVKLKVGKTATK